MGCSVHAVSETSCLTSSRKLTIHQASQREPEEAILNGLGMRLALANSLQVHVMDPSAVACIGAFESRCTLTLKVG
jgi:hypothetical protein